MCGIAGLWRVGDRRHDDGVAACARRMADRLRHRGPDDEGHWSDEALGVALSHRRLSIVDLSPHGHQPMVSADGRYVIAFNGEIYNFRELRAAIEPQGYPFKGHSDTEVLLAALGCWGVPATLERLNGMFAIALWDRAERRLRLARDRLGQKPVFFGWTASGFVFSSELKALHAVPDFPGEVDRDAVQCYLQLGYVPGPSSIYRGIFKLPPGTLLSVGERDARQSRSPRTLMTTYWSVVDCAEKAAAGRDAGADDEALAALDRTLQQATRYRMVSEVPLGAFLSGGIDSSLIVALMQAQSPRPIHSFALGFGDRGKGETEYARAIAEHLGTEHTELHISDREALDTVPDLPEIVDEPLADFAQVPNYLIARQARGHIKVALTGDGGDELFGGYTRFFKTIRRWRRLARWPGSLRRVAAVIAASGPRKRGDVQRKAEQLTRLRARSLDELYYYRMCQWLSPEPLLAGREFDIEPYFADGDKWPALTDPMDRLMLLDQIYYLQDVILTKVDRTSMACGLEVRSPLLDFHVAELSWRLPTRMKYRDGTGKWLMRELLARHVPRSLFERPKQGFGAPIGEWLDGPLYEWASDLLSPDRVRRHGLLNDGFLQKVWSERRVTDRSWQQRIWAVLMLQAWLEHNAA